MAAKKHPHIQPNSHISKHPIKTNIPTTKTSATISQQQLLSHQKESLAATTLTTISSHPKELKNPTGRH
jgi:hypothetical protein